MKLTTHIVASAMAAALITPALPSTTGIASPVRVSAFAPAKLSLAASKAPTKSKSIIAKSKAAKTVSSVRSTSKKPAAPKLLTPSAPPTVSTGSKVGEKNFVFSGVVGGASVKIKNGPSGASISFGTPASLGNGTSGKPSMITVAPGSSPPTIGTPLLSAVPLNSLVASTLLPGSSIDFNLLNLTHVNGKVASNTGIDSVLLSFQLQAGAFLSQPLTLKLFHFGNNGNAPDSICLAQVSASTCATQSLEYDLGNMMSWQSRASGRSEHLFRPRRKVPATLLH